MVSFLIMFWPFKKPLVLPYENLVEILKTFLEFFAASNSEWFFVIPERPDKFQAEKQIDRVSCFFKEKKFVP
jgi:hypothetical protein